MWMHTLPRYASTRITVKFDIDGKVQFDTTLGSSMKLPLDSSVFPLSNQYILNAYLDHISCHMWFKTDTMWPHLVLCTTDNFDINIGFVKKGAISDQYILNIYLYLFRISGHWSIMKGNVWFGLCANVKFNIRYGVFTLFPIGGQYIMNAYLAKISCYMYMSNLTFILVEAYLGKVCIHIRYIFKI